MSSLKVHIIIVNSIAVFLHFCNIGMKIETTICKRLKKRKKKKKKLYQVHKILNFLWGLRKIIDRLPYPPPPNFIYLFFVVVVGETDSQTQTYFLFVLMEDTCLHTKTKIPNVNYFQYCEQLLMFLVKFSWKYLFFFFNHVLLFLRWYVHLKSSKLLSRYLESCKSHLEPKDFKWQINANELMVAWNIGIQGGSDFKF